MKSKIKNLIFDFGNVLVDIDSRSLMMEYFKGDPDALAGFWRIRSNPDFVNECDRGDQPFADTIRKYQALNPEYTAALQYFVDNCEREVTGVKEGMGQLLKTLKENGYKLFGLTNWGDIIYKIIDRYAIFDLLDGMVISCEERLIKPDRAIYRCLTERYALNPSECLFTDDKQINVDGAEAAGMNAILFTSPEDYANLLRTIYKINI